MTILELFLSLTVVALALMWAGWFYLNVVSALR